MSFNVEHVHYRRQYVKCGRIVCKKCPHGPYWYAYQKSRGRLLKTYIGRELPERVIDHVKRLFPELADHLLRYTDTSPGPRPRPARP